VLTAKPPFRASIIASLQIHSDRARCAKEIQQRGVDLIWTVLVHLGISDLRRLPEDRRPTSRETEMPYFKPSPVADESALKRFGGRAQTVVRRCTRTKLRGQSAKAALTVPVYPPRSHSVVREVQRVALRRPIHKWAHIARRRETQKSVGDTGS